MAQQKIDGDLQLNGRILGLSLEQFESLPAGAKEALLGYHVIKKMPVYFDGFAFEYLVSESYVNKLLGGLSWKDDANVVSDVNIDIDILEDGYTIDGVTLHDEDRVLLINQTDKAENGIWLVGSKIRPYDLDDSYDFNNATIPVKGGLVYAGYQFRCKTVDPDVDISEIEFVDFGATVPDATYTLRGKIAVATLQEVKDGVVTNKAIAPDTLKSVLDVMRLQLAAVVPAPPQSLAGLSIVMTTYNAYEAGSGVVHVCTDDTTPDGTVTHFYDGDAGTLYADIDLVAQGTRILSTGSDVGTYGALVITDDSDPIAVGSLGHGIYKQLTAIIRAVTGLSLGQHTYRMRHSVTGTSATLTFWVDNPGTPVVSAVATALPVISRYVSGVPSLKSTDTITIGFTVAGAVQKHYNNVMARVTGSQIATVSVSPSSVPAEGASVVFSGVAGVVANAVYSEALTLAITGYNSKALPGTAYNHNTTSRVDTVSNEGTRRESGSGLYPASGYGAAFNSQQSLKTYYTGDLQLLNGRYRVPTGNYSTNLPTAGPDYSSGMGAQARYVLFDLGITLSSASSLVITLPSVLGTWSGIETAGLTVQVKVEGSTGWLDANKTFSLLGAPAADGDACMVYAESMVSVKKVSFGNVPRSGKLWVRIGLAAGSDKSFGQGVTVSNIS